MIKSALALLALLAGVWSAWTWIPLAAERGYAELPWMAVPITLWGMWLGRRYGRPGPALSTGGAAPALLLAAIAVGALATPSSWIASLAVAPAVYLLLETHAPAWATPRVFLLLFLAPLSFVLDRHFGPALQVGTAWGASALAGLWDGELGTRIHEQLVCGPHIIEVTPACSGARLSVRMLAVAAVLGVLDPLPARATLSLFGGALVFSALANAGRIAALCVAAPSYGREELEGLELYHDLSGLAAFVLAFAVLRGLAVLLGRLSGRRGS